MLYHGCTNNNNANHMFSRLHLVKLYDLTFTCDLSSLGHLDRMKPSLEEKIKVQSCVFAALHVFLVPALSCMFADTEVAVPALHCVFVKTFGHTCLKVLPERNERQ